MKSIQEAVASVQNAFPSIYTKDDVINLLNSIEIETSKSNSSKLTQQQIESLCESVLDEIRNNARNLDSSNVIDSSSAEFSVNYGNTIEIDSIDIDTDEIASNVVDGVADVIEQFFEELYENEESDVVELERENEE